MTFDSLSPIVIAAIPSVVTALGLWLHRRSRLAEARKLDAEAVKVQRGGDHDLGEMLLKWTTDAREHAKAQQERADRLEAALAQARAELRRWKSYAAALTRAVITAGGQAPDAASYGINDNA